MFRFDPVGKSQIHIEYGIATANAMQDLLDQCSMPLLVHNFHCAAILGSATLLRCGARHLLLTAAHLFDQNVQVGNLLVTAANHAPTQRLLPLHHAIVRRSDAVDLAVLDISAVDTLDDILHQRTALPVEHALDTHLEDDVQEEPPVHAVCGFPAAWSRFERGWVAARRLTILTHRLPPRHAQRCAHERWFAYQHVAMREDGTDIHTPALEGLSGAGIWRLQHIEAGSMVAHLCAVQSAFMHGQYLRGDSVQAAVELLRT
jgi:hypothetical protein